MKVRGYYQILVNDSIKAESSNLILDSLATMYASGSFSSSSKPKCYVGTSAVPPTAADIALGAEVASTDSSKNLSAISMTPVARDGSYFLTMAMDFYFDHGSVIANLSELGVSLAGSTVLNTKALIKDAAGNATTVTATEDDTLVVRYTIEFEFVSETTYNILARGVATTVTVNILNAHNYWKGFLWAGLGSYYYMRVTDSSATIPSPFEAFVNSTGTQLTFGSGTAGDAVRVFDIYLLEANVPTGQVDRIYFGTSGSSPMVALTFSPQLTFPVEAGIKIPLRFALTAA